MPTSRDERQIVVRSFPSTDRDFADELGDALDAALAKHDSTDALAEVVQARLRRGYPNARIQVQDELGHLGTDERIWYAYRDGRIRGNDPARERLYSVVAAARRTVREAKIAMDHARMASRAAGYHDDPSGVDAVSSPRERRKSLDPPRHPR